MMSTVFLHDNVTTNCTNVFTVQQLKILGITQVLAGGISLLGCISIALLIVILKKYKDSTQRLVLYLNITVILNSIGTIVRGGGYAIENIVFCTGIASYTQFTSSCILASICCIIIELVLKAVRQKGAERYEWIYIILTFVVPLMVSLLPFIKNGYGYRAAWCWIRNTDETTCEKFVYGIILQYTLWYGPLYVLAVIGGLTYLFAFFKINKQLRKYKRNYTSNMEELKHKTILEELAQFRWYPVIYLIINIAPLATSILDIINPNHAILPLWIVTAIIQGLQGLFIAAVFIINPSTRKSLKYRQLKILCAEEWGLTSCVVVEDNTTPLVMSSSLSESFSFEVIEGETDLDKVKTRLKRHTNTH